MNKYIVHLLLLSSGYLYSEDLKLEGWKEGSVNGQSGASVSKSYWRTEDLNGFQVRMNISHIYSKEHDFNNILQEIEIKQIGEGDDKLTKIARCTSTEGGKNAGFWFYLNSENDKYQVYAGVSGKNGNHFAQSGERFISVIPRDIGIGKEYWILSFIADTDGIYHLYNKADSTKFNGIVK